MLARWWVTKGDWTADVRRDECLLIGSSIGTLWNTTLSLAQLPEGEVVQLVYRSGTPPEAWQSHAGRHPTKARLFAAERSPAGLVVLVVEGRLTLDGGEFDGGWQPLAADGLPEPIRDAIP